MKPSWHESIYAWLSPSNPSQLNALLHAAQKKHILNNDSFRMMTSIIKMDRLKVRDIMIPRAQMILLHQDQPITEALAIMAKSRHSRFPVCGDKRDTFIGLLLAKDLIGIDSQDNPSLQSLCRPITCIPESTRIGHLLKSFLSSHTHLAIVADEFGSISGLITLEDIIEQVIGEIEDEHFDEQAHQKWLKRINNHTHLIQAQTYVATVNKTLNIALPENESDTIGGLMIQRLGHIPKKGERLYINPFSFSVEQACDRKIDWIKLEQIV